MSARHILVLGGGFAGLWSAVGAARKLDELGKGRDAAVVTLVNRDSFHNIRVRNESYVTILDLGSWGALYTEGWDRRVVAQGESAKRTKQMINGQRIYPPLTGDRAEILAAAEPVIQKAPEIHS